MGLGRRVLLVSPTASLSQTLAQSIQRAGYPLTIVSTFQAAKTQLKAHPELLITELKLGEYNGLQLALRSRADGIPAILVADKAFEQDAEQLGVMWMSPEAAAGDELHVAMIRLLLDAVSHQVELWYEEGHAPREDGPIAQGAHGLLH